MARLDLRRMWLLPLATRESLRRARFTGYTLDGGYAEYSLADERFCFRFPTLARTLKPRRSSARD